jgi:hypothetical protein
VKTLLALSLSLSLIACGGGEIEQEEIDPSEVTSWRETQPRPITFLECSYSPSSPCTIVWPPQNCTGNDCNQDFKPSPF